jgi:inorganic pyrophosphatase
MHLIHEVPYHSQKGQYAMVVEIPAGTNEKWQTDPETGELYFQHVDGKPRIMRFLSYPFNYGFMPQTLSLETAGGDGDPLDVVLISPALERGTVQQVRIIGALKLVERGQDDIKLLAVLPQGDFAEIHDVAEMLVQYPNLIEIIRLWFLGYKRPSTFTFHGYATSSQVIPIIEEAHQAWAESRGLKGS